MIGQAIEVFKENGKLDKRKLELIARQTGYPPSAVRKAEQLFNEGAERVEFRTIETTGKKGLSS